MRKTGLTFVFCESRVRLSGDLSKELRSACDLQGKTPRVLVEESENRSLIERLASGCRESRLVESA